MTNTNTNNPIGFHIITCVDDPVCDVTKLQKELVNRGLAADEIKAKPLTEAQAWKHALRRTMNRQANCGSWSVGLFKGEGQKHMGTVSMHIGHSDDEGHAEGKEVYVVIWRDGLGCVIRKGADHDALQEIVTNDGDTDLARAIQAAYRTAEVTKSRFQKWSGMLSASAISRLIARTIKDANALPLGLNGGCYYMPAGPIADHLKQVLDSISAASEATKGRPCADVDMIDQWPSPGQTVMLERAATNSLGAAIEKVHAQIKAALGTNNMTTTKRERAISELVEKAAYYRTRLGVKLDTFDAELAKLQNGLVEASGSDSIVVSDAESVAVEEDHFADDSVKTLTPADFTGEITKSELRKECRLAKADNSAIVRWEGKNYWYRSVQATSVNALIAACVTAGLTR